MKPDPEKPIRYGIMPMGLLYLGYLVILGAAMFGSMVFRWFQWFFRWLGEGN